MKRSQFKTAAAVALAFAALSGCAPSLTYSVFPSETTGPRSGSFETGYVFEHGIGVPRDYARARSEYEAASKGGDARADVNLGVMALQGRGSNSSASSAFSHFRKAASRDSANGRYNLALMYDLGIGRSPDPVAAAWEYRMAAEQGLALAQHRLAQMLEGGQGVPASRQEAERLYSMAAVRGDAAALARLDVLKGTGWRGMDASSAAELFAREHCASCRTSSERDMASRGYEDLRRLAAQGDAPARYNLAVRMLQGESAVHDPSEAARLFTLAARQGYAPAQRQLAQMHMRGQAVARSKKLAHAWLNLASRARGHEGEAARREMEGLEVTMTVTEIREAQKIAADGALLGR